MSFQTDSLSERGQLLASTPARADFDLFLEASANRYHPAHSPDGAFPLNVAENALAAPLVQRWIDKRLKAGGLPEWTLKYTHTLGHPPVREALAQFMRRYFCSSIQAGQLALSAGASASLEVLAFVLANPGDAVAIPAPAYPMYTKDLGIKAGMHRYDIVTHHHLTPSGAIPRVEETHLEQAWNDLAEQDRALRMVVITSPDNPTGAVYDREQLERLAIWCIDREVHLLVNEIYALSRLEDAPAPDSFARLMAEYESPFLHLAYAMSKDFSMSGFRLGVLHSWNDALMAGISNANIPHMASNIAQWIMGEMLQDEAFVESYLKEVRRLISKSCSIGAATMRRMGVPFAAPEGSLFIWADFSKHLPSPDWAGDEALWRDIYRQTGVLLTPGAGFGHSKPGMFRIVHTALPLEHFQVAMQRLEAYRPG